MLIIFLVIAVFCLGLAAVAFKKKKIKNGIRLCSVAAAAMLLQWYMSYLVQL